ncbi:hypothetical protein GGR28_000645 [Lewinella aquimaris]|uniref:Uncharacterized protein n=1 Tax=Neolewinella aquimaris TaxID=1835722 RepID=A0A840DXV4_9BACT|nr:hypothetical protein [Neolewinella aquimaris]MBB4078044.1 hypothetical protein [Neolewinella aquimaris]
MRHLASLTLLIGIFLFAACTKEEVDPAGSGPVRSYEQIAGYVQKGPFLNGTSIQLAELSGALIPTGSTYTTQIADNRGSFTFPSVELRSQYVQLRADGFYYNEVTDESSTAQLTLYALSDLGQYDGLNVNLLSHLEKARVEYLLADGESFAAAKRRAQEEIFAIFGMQPDGARESHLLDISASGTDNAKLLAISVILQGYLSVQEFSEFLANISTDLREDGTLDSKLLGSQLINNATLLHPASIRQQLVRRYEEMGQTVVIPRFEDYLAIFIATTTFEQTNKIRYPTSGSHGLNVLDMNQDTDRTGSYSMVADLPENTSLKVKVSGTNWMFPAFQDGSGWDYSQLEQSDTSRFFTTNRTGVVDFELLFTVLPSPPPPYDNGIPGSDDNSQGTNPYIPPPRPVFTRIEVYENGASEPRWTRTLRVNR